MFAPFLPSRIYYMYRLITVVVKESILSFHLNNIHLGVIQTQKGVLELVRTLFSVQAMETIWTSSHRTCILGQHNV